MFGPFKCPDCGVWWAGFQHRCEKPLTLPGSLPVPNTIPNVGDLYFCNTCQKYVGGAHYCPGPDTTPVKWTMNNDTASDRRCRCPDGSSCSHKR